jgi:hypothetical protein
MCACVKDNTDKNLLSVWRSPRGKEPVGTCRQRIYMTLAIVGHSAGAWRITVDGRRNIHPPPPHNNSIPSWQISNHVEFASTEDRLDATIT